MIPLTRQTLLGAGLAGIALLLILSLIPDWVASPAAGSLVLRPDFWPRVLAWLLLAAGLGLVAQAMAGQEPEAPPEDADGAGRLPGIARLAGLAAVLLGISWGTPAIGMVWTTVLAFWALLMIVRPRGAWIAVLVGLLLPIALYAFFSKFAGVPIPQGPVLRLP